MASISFIANEPDAQQVWTSRLGQRAVWQRPQFVVDGTVANVEPLDDGRVRVRISMPGVIRCPGCDVLPFSLHEVGCDVARCLRTGLQLLSCVASHYCGEDLWVGISGVAPNVADAERYGVDLDTLTGSGRFRWDRQSQQWMPKKQAHSAS